MVGINKPIILKDSKMVVYIVWWNNFHSEDEFSGVFLTRENAETCISKYDQYEQQSFRIEETTLDNW